MIKNKLNKLNKSQLLLLIMLYLLVALMVIFSIGMSNNSGQEGYDKCIDWKCETGGEEYCTKVREINNCCSGAGGKTGINGSQYICVFQ